MTKICNFPIARGKRCTQPMADNRPNCGRHHCEVSEQQLGQRPVVYEKDGELHVWPGKPDGVYCLIHSDSSYQTLYRLARETQPCCLDRIVEWRDEDGRLHRDDGPAWILPDGTQSWYQHGEWHRDDGPAIIRANDTKEWYQHGRLHRDDGPARVRPDGSMFWYYHGERHRGDGPARIWSDGTQEWFWHGEEVTKEEHERLCEQFGGV